MNAAAIALGMQAEVLLLDRNIARLREADRSTRGTCGPSPSNAYEIERAVLDADLVIGAVLVPGREGAEAGHQRAWSPRMKPGSVLVDIAIDQGGCFEDSRPTTHADPVYRVHNSLFYCVANMPGAVPHTSTYALTNVTLPYAVELANRAGGRRCKQDHSLALGLNTHDGHVTYGPVADAHDLYPAEARRGARSEPRHHRGRSARYLDHLTVERGLAANTLASYRRDLRRYDAYLGGRRHRRPRPDLAKPRSATS